MTCNACGEKPKKCGNCNKDFPRAVIEINNPETLVLLRKVVIPASMGTEEQVPPAIGKYHNVILYYEANKHVYLYSSDGIPTLLEMDIPQELLDRIEDLEDGLSTLEEEFEEFKNSPDVVDIVATYADLQEYDTSSLGDKDIVRVLSDETHGGASTYYRWMKNDSQWEYIGTFGDSITVLSEEDYDYPDNNPVGVALWRLPDGIYHNPKLVQVYVCSSIPTPYSASSYYIKVSGGPNNATQIYRFDGGGDTIRIYWVNPADGSCNDINRIFLKSTDCIDWLNSTAINRPLSANQGKVLNERIGDLSTLATTAKTSAVAAINEVNSVIGLAKVLTEDDFNWNSITHSTADPKDSVALWLLNPGIYTVPNGLTAYAYRSTYTAATSTTYIVGAGSTWGVPIVVLRGTNYATIGWECGTFYLVDASGSKNYEYSIGSVIDDLNGYAYTNRPLSARQGNVLNNMIGDISALTTTAKSSTVAAINELVARVSALEGN